MAGQGVGGGKGLIRVGIVGTGIRGKMYAGICGATAGVELVGLCDISRSALEAARQRFGVPGFAETPEMCRKCSPEVVVIATPDFAHVAPALAAAEAGCSLLIEKPLAMSVADARRICQAVADNGVRAMVAFENHWNAPFSAMKAAAEAGELGRMVSCCSQLDDRIDVPTRLLSWSGGSSPGWFLMAHTVELAGWIAGQRPVRAAASAHKGILAERGIDTYDAIHAVIDFDGAMAGAFSSCWVLPESLPLIYQFRHEMVGQGGSMRADLTDQMLHKAAGRYEHPSTVGVTVRQAGRKGEKSQSATSAASPPGLMFREFISAVATGGPVPCPLADGLVNVAVIAAVHQAVETRGPVEVKL